MRRCSVLLVALASVLAPATARGGADAPADAADCVGDYCASDAIYQFAPSAAFAASLFDGPTRFADVLRLGDFGLGGTSPLEGEVIVLDGAAYHARPTGISSRATRPGRATGRCSGSGSRAARSSPRRWSW